MLTIYFIQFLSQIIFILERKKISHWYVKGFYWNLCHLHLATHRKLCNVDASFIQLFTVPVMTAAVEIFTKRGRWSRTDGRSARVISALVKVRSSSQGGDFLLCGFSTSICNLSWPSHCRVCTYEIMGKYISLRKRTSWRRSIRL